MGMAVRSSTETLGYSRFRRAPMAAILMCFGRAREKQNRYGLQFSGPLCEADLRSSVRLSMAQKETVSSERNDREELDRSKKRRLMPGSKGDSDRANARAHYTA